MVEWSSVVITREEHSPRQSVISKLLRKLRTELIQLCVTNKRKPSKK